jgi:hypothetical protein
LWQGIPGRPRQGLSTTVDTSQRGFSGRWAKLIRNDVFPAWSDRNRYVVYDCDVPAEKVPEEKDPPRRAVSARLKEACLAWVDLFATEEDRKRSDMVRILVEEAVKVRIAKRPQAAPKKGPK